MKRKKKMSENNEMEIMKWKLLKLIKRYPIH